MLVTKSSCSSVFGTEMATFTYEEQRVIIRFLHLRGMKPIEIHRQLRETCSDGVMDVKNVRSWVRQSKKAERRVTWGVQVLRSPNLFKKTNYPPQEAENAVIYQGNHPVDIHIFHNADATIAWPQQTLL